MDYDYVEEKVFLFEEKHPHYQLINEKIIEESKQFNFSRDCYNKDGSDSNVKSLQTRNVNSPSISLINDWVLSLIEGVAGYLYTVDNKWIAKYNKGDYTASHHHIPASFAFVYFIRCPIGSSPLVFTTSGKEIKAEEGKVVVFSGCMNHHVPKNECDDRIVLSGNVFPLLE
tara:strand:+ start:240 stop:752 length:513 start_codon:yes stop_codon:yes gene_type:complete